MALHGKLILVSDSEADIDVKDDSKPRDLPKYQQILVELRRTIANGQSKTGDRLPSETDLGKTFGVSRLTVQRALKELQIEGLVARRAGSGTYVLPRKQSHGHLFGLLIPGLGESEIFEPMCQGMAKAGRSGGHALLWGHATHSVLEDKEFLAHQLCDDYIARRVSGVFFAPLEGFANKDAVNLSITQRLSDAGIAVVLLDRCIYAWPNRSPFDLIGIDNRRGGHVVTRHMLGQGALHPVFLTRPNSAPTVDQRYAGFVEAVRAQGLCPGEIIRGNPADKAFVQKIMESREPDAFVCANDVTAANLMQTLETLGLAVPADIRISGFDDVRYANLLRVPLTTLRQPCQELGETAIQAMLSRLAHRTLPARDILLDCKLVVRKSCGYGA
jgi:GntR family transcriptional regulator of arabinose operon